MKEDNFQGGVKLLGVTPKKPVDGVVELFASVILQAWEDAQGVKGESCRISRKRNTLQAREFLTGNYSRELFAYYCQAVGVNPNYIIKQSMKQSWAKDIEPKYFQWGD